MQQKMVPKATLWNHFFAVFISPSLMHSFRVSSDNRYPTYPPYSQSGIQPWTAAALEMLSHILFRHSFPFLP